MARIPTRIGRGPSTPFVFIPALGDLSLSGSLVAGVASSGVILNATTGSTITSSIPGLTVNSGARTYSYTGAGSAGAVQGLVETLAGATFSPRNNFVTIVSAAIPAFTTNPSISPTSGDTATTFTAVDGAMSNGGAILSRRWLLNGTSIGSGATIVTGAQGSLVLENTGTGNVVATSPAITVAAATPAPSPTISFAAPTATVTEGNTGTKTVSNTVNVTRNGITGPLTINLSYGGTADGSDYSGPISGTIASGNSSLVFDVTISGDAVVEPDETIVITASLAGYSATASKTITITNDDVTANPSARSLPTVSPTTTGSNYAAQVQALGGLTGFYQLNEPAETTNFVDTVNTSRKVVASSTQFARSGLPTMTDANGKAVGFAKTRSAVLVASEADSAAYQVANGQPLSVHAVVAHQDQMDSATGSAMTIASCALNAAPFTGWAVSLRKIATSVNVLRFEMEGADGTALEVYGTVNVPAGVPTPVAVTYDGSRTAAGVRFFVNGVEDTGAKVVVTETLGASSVTTGGGRFVIGGRGPDVAGGIDFVPFSFGGYVSNVAIHNRVLTQTEIAGIADDRATYTTVSNVSAADYPDPTTKLRLIYGDDNDSDVDGVTGIAGIAAMAKAGMFDLIAFIVSSKDPYAAACGDILFKYAAQTLDMPALANVPVGAWQGTTDDPNDFPYGRATVDKFRPSPATMRLRSEFPSSTTVMRQALAASPDGSVVIAEGGTAHCLEALRDSPGDANDPRSGWDLLKAKCLGVFFTATRPGSTGNESNVRWGLAAAKTIYESFPVPILSNGNPDYNKGAVRIKGVTASTDAAANTDPFRFAWAKYGENKSLAVGTYTRVGGDLMAAHFAVSGRANGLYRVDHLRRQNIFRSDGSGTLSVYPGAAQAYITCVGTDADYTNFFQPLIDQVSTAPQAATPTVNLSAVSTQLNEGNAGTQTEFRYTVTKSDPSVAADVPYSFTAGDTNAADWAGGVLPTGGVLSIPAGQESASYSFFVNGDNDVEPNETFSTAISAPTGFAAGATMTATGTILNDDSAAGFTTAALVPNTSRTYANNGYIAKFPAKTAGSTITATSSDGTAMTVDSLGQIRGKFTAAGSPTISVVETPTSGPARTSTYTLTVNPAAPFYDTYTDVDATKITAHTSDSGATYTSASTATNLEILNGRVYAAQGGGRTYSSYAATGADQWVEFDVIVFTKGVNTQPGAFLRQTSTNVGYFGFLNYTSGVRNWAIGRFNTSGSVLASGPEANIAENGTVYHCRFTVSGSTLTLEVDGVVTVTVDSTAITAAGRLGAITFNGTSGVSTATTGCHIDNVAAGTL